MKFAVVEYSTKTNRVWRHTPARPNYYGDPQHEIDPTSFACYTSALLGEHIPLRSFITGGMLHRLYKRVVGRWPQTYALQYFAPFTTLLVVHQISAARDLTAFVRRVKAQYPHLAVIGVPTHPFGLLELAWQKDQSVKKNLIRFAQACDVFISIVKSTVSTWEQVIQRRVYYLPQPYPVEYARQFFKRRSEKQNIIFVAGVTDRPTIVLGQQVATAVQKQLPSFLIRVTATPGVRLDSHHLSGSRFEVVPFENWQEHLKTLAKIALVINTDFTQTRGRVQMDGAAVGTPTLGADSDAQLDLFPRLAATLRTPLDQLVEHACHLLRDKNYYTALVTAAQNRLAYYTYERSAERLRTLVREITHA